MDAVMKENIGKIKNIENEYGLVLFRMGLSHLFDAGHRHFNDGDVEVDIAQIMAEGEIEKANGVRSMITPEFKCEIVRCSDELAPFSIWTLFTYIKKNVDVSN